MKWPLSLLPCLVALHCFAQSQTATVTAYCRSLCLRSSTTTYNGVSTFDFTTADNTSGQPLYIPVLNGMPIVSNELRPAPGSPGTYESDFVMLAGTSPEIYGTLALNIPNLNTNQDYLPDVLDPALPMYTLISGTGYSSWPSSNYFTLSLRFYRAAGSPSGVFSGNWNYGGGSYLMNGAFNLMLLQGSASYTRGATNQLQLQLTRTVSDGTTTTLTGAVAYTASANQISLPRFTLTDTNGQTYTALHTVLTRHGQRYTGNLSFVDGAPETPWPDYQNWIVSLTDTNDADGNGIPDLSDPSAVHLPSAPLTLTTNGPGSVSPSFGGQELVLGKTYHLTATPAVGYLFTGWSGDLVSSARTLSFTMETNLNLQANFVPNPFYPVRGTYYGLIEDTNDLANDTLGTITASTTVGGTYSVKLQLGGQAYSLSGALDETGSASRVIIPKSLRPLTLQLHLDLTNNTGLSGFITDGNWNAAINANQAVFNAATNRCALAGKYTFALPSSGADGALPLGSSYGTMSIDTAGHIRCALSLADGKRATQSTVLSSTGDWPFYASLYNRQGCLAGWLSLTNLQAQPIAGLPVWVKPANTTKYAADGFTNLVTWLLSPYSPLASGTPPVGWTNGLASFDGGDLPEPFSVDVTVGSHYKLAGSGTNQLSLRLVGNGLFQGRVIPAGASRPVPFQGALLQSLDQGFGYVPGPTQCGEVQLGQAVLPP